MLTPQDDDPIARWSGKHFGGHYQVTKLVARRGHTGTLYTVCGNVQRHMHMAKKDPPNLAVPGQTSPEVQRRSRWRAASIQSMPVEAGGWCTKTRVGRVEAAASVVSNQASCVASSAPPTSPSTSESRTMKRYCAYRERVVIRRGTWLLLAEDHLAKRLPEVMIPQGKIGRHAELIGEMFAARDRIVGRHR